MRKNKSLIPTVLIFCLSILVVSAQGDVFMKQKHHTDSFTMMGQTQPAQDSFQSIWFTADKIRSDQEKSSSIVRLDLNLMYALDHEKKTYMTIPLNFSAMQTEKMPKDLGIKISITPTGETKKINKWNCKKYLQNMEVMGMNVTSEVWATEDIKMDLNVYSKYVSASMQMNPAMKAGMDKLVKEMKKIKGVHVLTVTTNTIMGQTMKSSQELVEFKEGKAPAGIFDLPAGYKMKKMSGMMR
ncbi:DUF4412 domain-containing protein [candidate division KSB1 bacterium]|nr:DUF4412 domain-containing protein [candidate division KSB1 bacterium]